MTLIKQASILRALPRDVEVPGSALAFPRESLRARRIQSPPLLATTLDLCRQSTPRYLWTDNKA